MTPWLIATIALLPPFAAAVLAGCRGKTGARLVALQLASSLAGLLLVTLTFALDEAAFIDLALAVSLLTLPGMLVMTLFLERWL